MSVRNEFAPRLFQIILRFAIQFDYEPPRLAGVLQGIAQFLGEHGGERTLKSFLHDHASAAEISKHIN